METQYLNYDFQKSFSRIDDILNQSDTSFSELKEIPPRNYLTFKNGFYVNCSAIFVDIRDSSSLPSVHRRPTLAKIYRTYISEIVAIMNGNLQCSEIRIDGDCIGGIFNTTSKPHMDNLIGVAARINSLVKVLNYKFSKKGIKNIRIGIGIDYGRALMIKSGYSGSGLNELVWMGEVVNQASKLCDNANKLFSMPIFISNLIYNNLNNHNKSLFEFNSYNNCHQGNIINIPMEEWYQANCTT